MTAKIRPGVCVVDVCGTLVFDDTTLGLLRYHFARDINRRMRYLAYEAMTMYYSPFRWGIAVLEKLLRRHFLKHIVIRMLAGDKVKVLEQSGSEYAKKLLAERQVPTVWAILKKPLMSGQVLLASASLEPVVAALASVTGERYVASTLECRNGVLTGCYTEDLTGCKEQALIKKYGRQLFDGQVTVISDNFSDRLLMEKAALSYVVLRHPKHRQRWQGLNATFLEISE